MSAAITRDMPEADYHANLSLSSTGARRLLDCPARYRWEADHPTPPTDAMQFGKAVHRHLLGTGAEIAVSDEWTDFRTKAAQEWKAKVEATGAVALLESGKDWQHIRAMRAALDAHPSYARLFDPERGDAEVSVFWTDEDTGVPCRARFDFLPHPVEGRRLIVPDLKKTVSAQPGEFARSVAKYGYAQQAAWYLDAVRALNLDADPAFVFVVIEDKAPYLVSVLQLSLVDLNRGRALNRLARRMWADCTELGSWPGYTDDAVAVMDLPTYWRMTADDLLEMTA